MALYNSASVWILALLSVHQLNADAPTCFPYDCAKQRTCAGPVCQQACSQCCLVDGVTTNSPQLFNLKFLGADENSWKNIKFGNPTLCPNNPCTTFCPAPNSQNTNAIQPATPVKAQCFPRNCARSRSCAGDCQLACGQCCLVDGVTSNSPQLFNLKFLNPDESSWNTFKFGNPTLCPNVPCKQICPS